MKVQRDNKAYHFQIKSSPNTMSIDQVRQLNTHIQNIKDKLTAKELRLVEKKVGDYINWYEAILNAIDKLKIGP